MKGGGGNLSLPISMKEEENPYYDVYDDYGNEILCPICLTGWEYGKPIIECGGNYSMEADNGCHNFFHKECWTNMIIKRKEKRNELRKQGRSTIGLPPIHSCPLCRRDKPPTEIRELNDDIEPQKPLDRQIKPLWVWPHSRKWTTNDLYPSLEINTGLSKHGGKRKTKRKKKKRNRSRKILTI